MNEELRRAAAHVIVDDVELPVLAESARHHLTRVLRLRGGETVSVTDGEGAWRLCMLEGETLEPTDDVQHAERSRRVTLGVAIPKQDRPEWLVQKATELGVDRLVFLHADRSVVRWSPERADRHLLKLRTIAREAAMQSRRVWVPRVDGPQTSADFLPTSAVAEPGGRAVEAGDSSIAVGPEGGWTPKEVDLAQSVVDLGEHVLRVETAALAAAVLMRRH